MYGNGAPVRYRRAQAVSDPRAPRISCAGAEEEMNVLFISQILPLRAENKTFCAVCNGWPYIIISIKERRRVGIMGIVPYALMAYGLTIVISLAVVAVIVITNNVINRKSKKGEEE